MPTTLSTNQLEKLKTQGVENSFILFKADWCGYCTEFMPVYEELERMFEKHPMKNGKPIRFYVYNCTKEENARHAATKYNIEGYPTLKWINESGDIEDYPGGRDKDDIIAYICKKKNVCLKSQDVPMNQVGGGLTNKDLKQIFRTSKIRGRK